jgi:hypothetical protein
VKRIRWSRHAVKNLTDREIDRTEADKTLAEPELVSPGQPPRQVLMRRYFDRLLQQEMLLRIVVEDTASERIVVTVYKTAQLSKYLKGQTP